MARDLFLCIDIGTGSVRAALVDAAGRILHIASREHAQIVPAFGWAEQRPDDWWAGTVHTVRAALAEVADARARIAAICACGQMHGTVLVDAEGRPTRDTAPLWNDKRTASLAAEYDANHATAAYLPETANPATPAWPAFKLAWLRDHDSTAYARARTMLMPKDYVNLRLTGIAAMDTGDASCSFLMHPATFAWSPRMLAQFGIDPALLPPIRAPGDLLGAVTAVAAAETGLAEGTPVLTGGADFAMALLGSGACHPGVVSDVTGTSCILTLIADRPLLDPEICNIATVEGHWGAFVALETGGDGPRWARRALHDNTLTYAETAARAAAAPAGSGGLLFLPYLTGERLGAHRNRRAQLFGLGASHGAAELHRAVLEGVAFAATRHLRVMEAAAGRKVEHAIASGGGAKSPLWLRIKASTYGIPISVPREAECGVIGCAALAATATGRFAQVTDAVATYVHFDDDVLPDPAWAGRYARMQPIFDRLYDSNTELFDALDRLPADDRAAATR